MTTREAITGGVATVVISVVTWFLNDYKKLKDFKALEDEKRMLEKERKVIEQTLHKMDSIYLLKAEKELAYKVYFDSTISFVQQYINSEDTKTQEALDVISDTTSDYEIDSIYAELKTHQL